jgi:hypothetical protein
LDRLYNEELPAIFFCKDGRFAFESPVPCTLLSGSFNPVHDAHWKLAEIAGQRTGRATHFEISIVNVDKPSLSREEVCHRLRQFANRASVWVTRAPTFAEKARLFPSSIFAIGGDTAERLLLPRYYSDDRNRMLQALELIRSQECSFLVAGRINSQGRFCSLEDLPIPAEYCDMFTAIPREEFDYPVSSTKLRGQRSSP